jgi:hypothetical protein
LGKEKQWFYTNKEVVSTWEKCSNAFLAMFLPLGKTNALQNKISSFQQLTDETIVEAWARLNGRVLHHPELLSWADLFYQGTY